MSATATTYVFVLTQGSAYSQVFAVALPQQSTNDLVFQEAEQLVADHLEELTQGRACRSNALRFVTGWSPSLHPVLQLHSASILQYVRN